MRYFHNIFKYMLFQRRHKALLWSKGLKAHAGVSRNQTKFLPKSSSTSTFSLRAAKTLARVIAAHDTISTIIPYAGSLILVALQFASV